MVEKKTSPLLASFWLTEQEKRYILVICAIFLLGLAGRYLYLKHEKPVEYTPVGLEQPEQDYE